MAICHKPMISTLFYLCFKDKILDAERARAVCSLLKKGYIEYDYFTNVLHDFDKHYLGYYNTASNLSKEQIIEKESKVFVNNELEIENVLKLYDYIVPIYPNLADYISKHAADCCLRARRVKDNEGRIYLRKFGASNKYSKSLLWRHLGNVCLILFLILIALVGFILIMTHTIFWWVVALLGPACMALGIAGIQYVVMLFAAIANFFRKNHFTFDTTILGYAKNSNGTGSYKVIRDKSNNY